MHLPFTPNHVQLINACYPPSATLLSAGPEYRPNSQELSKLTYYAANRPAKLNKLGSELEKRIVADCRRAQAGNVRSKAYVVIPHHNLGSTLMFLQLTSNFHLRYACFGSGLSS